MKIKTNLSPKELEIVSKGLSTLAKNQCTHAPLKAENGAEKELFRKMEVAYDEFVDDLHQATAEVISAKDL